MLTRLTWTTSPKRSTKDGYITTFFFSICIQGHSMRLLNQIFMGFYIESGEWALWLGSRKRRKRKENGIRDKQTKACGCDYVMQFYLYPFLSLSLYFLKWCCFLGFHTYRIFLAASFEIIISTKFYWLHAFNDFRRLCTRTANDWQFLRTHWFLLKNTFGDWLID